MLIQSPSPLLRDFVSHYWLSLNNADSTYPVLPDGAVDLVVEVRGDSMLNSVYGTTTARADIPVEPGSHYLGIRFRPGQSRHFLGASAYELTDSCEQAQGLLRFGLEDVPEIVGSGDVFLRLDEILGRHIVKRQPVPARIDAAIRLIEAAHGVARISEVAALFGGSRRQFERVFLETVGVSAKFFSRIARFQCASALIVQSSVSLADIAAGSGYSDQSHMNHEFKYLAGISPARYPRSDVAFLQDRSIP